jgi:transcriptional regulator with XRE-family HTH domain
MRRLAGVHPTSLSFIELGKREPSLAQLRRIAKALGVDPLGLASAGLSRRPGKAA